MDAVTVRFRAYIGSKRTIFEDTGNLDTLTIIIDWPSTRSLLVSHVSVNGIENYENKGEPQQQKGQQPPSVRVVVAVGCFIVASAVFTVTRKRLVRPSAARVVASHSPI